MFLFKSTFVFAVIMAQWNLNLRLLERIIFTLEGIF